MGLLADSLAGRRADGRTVPAKPLFVIHIPLDRITQIASGLLEVAVAGWLPTLNGRLTDQLAGDADIKAVIFDGARPLMVTRKLTAKDIPGDTRLACAARDLGARDPGGGTPIPLSDPHHLNDDLPGSNRRRAEEGGRGAGCRTRPSSVGPTSPGDAQPRAG